MQGKILPGIIIIAAIVGISSGIVWYKREKKEKSMHDTGTEFNHDSGGPPHTGDGSIQDPIDYGLPAPYGVRVQSISEFDPGYQPHVSSFLPYYQNVPNDKPLLQSLADLFDSGPLPAQALKKIRQPYQVPTYPYKNEHLPAWR